MNSKLGIALQAFALASFSPGYQPPTYNRRTQTYQRHEGASHADLDRLRQMALLPATHAGLGAPAGGGGCSAFDQVITATGISTVTMNCTGTISMRTWGGGSSYSYGGQAGAFASSPLGVTNGEVITVYVAVSAPTNTEGAGSFACPHSVSNCTSAAILGATSWKCTTPSGLSTANFACASGGNGASLYGDVAHSVGTVAFAGGHGGNGSGGSHAGGGAGGPDGAGGNFSGTTGGAGDNGSGGAGGTSGNSGASNAKGGGGGGSGAATNGGAPGGGSGGNGGTTAGTGGRGQVELKGLSMLSPDGRPIDNAGSGYGGGTVSMS